MTFQQLRTLRGRPYVVAGDASLVTLDRLDLLALHLDTDPRVASVSIVPSLNEPDEFIRATAPAGCAVLVATDFGGFDGGVEEDLSTEGLKRWAQDVSNRGLWHDWWLTSARDVAAADVLFAPSSVDVRERNDLASSRSSALLESRMNPNAMRIIVDGTWLGVHQTGSQVLTTAALQALASDDRVASIELTGIATLPDYAAHLGNQAKVRVVTPEHLHHQADVLWYPNQIDQRVDISGARTLARRIVTTYLDLIAYDIPRYHASEEAWLAYRSLQRRIALSVDGVTTISADVARSLHREVPSLDEGRISAIPLGLDHIQPATTEPGEDITDLAEKLGNRPYLLVLGNDFQHKNRDFAVCVWEEVLAKGHNCDLVLAGLHVRSSSSRVMERELLAQHTNLRGEAHSVDHVSAQSREWLLAHAAVTLYPSSAEGFGFVPYEAAAMGTPATFTAFGPLSEISQLSDVPRGWSVQDYAQDVAQLLSDADFAKERVDGLRKAISRFTWERFADRLITFMQAIDSMPPAPGALVGGAPADAAALAAVLSSRTWRATSQLRGLVRKFRQQ